MRENLEDPKEVFATLSDESAAAMPIVVIVNMDNADVRAKRISCSAVEFLSRVTSFAPWAGLSCPRTTGLSFRKLAIRSLWLIVCKLVTNRSIL